MLVIENIQIIVDIDFFIFWDSERLTKKWQTQIHQLLWEDDIVRRPYELQNNQKGPSSFLNKTPMLGKVSGQGQAEPSSGDIWT